MYNYTFFFFNDTATTEIYTLSLQTLFRSTDLGAVRRREKVDLLEPRCGAEPGDEPRRVGRVAVHLPLGAGGTDAAHVRAGRKLARQRQQHPQRVRPLGLDLADRLRLLGHGFELRLEREGRRGALA